MQKIYFTTNINSPSNLTEKLYLPRGKYNVFCMLESENELKDVYYLASESITFTNRFLCFCYANNTIPLSQSSSTIEEQSTLSFTIRKFSDDSLINFPCRVTVMFRE